MWQEGNEGLGEEKGGETGEWGREGEGASCGSALVVGGYRRPGRGLQSCCSCAAIAIKVEVAAVYAMMLHREQVYQ